MFDDLPCEFIIKANHASGWNKTVRDKSQLDIPATCRYFNKCMRRKYGRRVGELHYSLIEPKIVIEELLQSDGELPGDYLFYCHNSPEGFDFTLTITYSDPIIRIHFDSDWNVIEGELTEEIRERFYKPPNFDEMVEVVRTVSRDFDFVRVDLYNIDGKIYCGELTLTPGGGLQPIEHASRLELRNQMWTLDADNELLYRPRRK